jgi:hypothetical protein
MPEASRSGAKNRAAVPTRAALVRDHRGMPMYRPAAAAALPLLFLAASFPARAAPDDFRVLSDEMPDAGETETELQVAYLKPPRNEEHRSPVIQTLFEVSRGITPLWEISLQLPATRLDGNWHLTGVNLETQFVSSRGEPGFYWGARIEVARSAPVGEPMVWSTEWRPILGWRAGDWHLIANPGLDIPLSGPERRAIFEPYAKVARRVAEETQLGIEYFAEAGPLRRFWPANERSEWLLAVVDTEIGGSEVHFGLGKGLTSGSDSWVMKMRIAY